MFGLAIGVFFFEKDFQTADQAREEDAYLVLQFPVAVLPYSTTWENSGEIAGLFQSQGKFYNIIHQKIENDTAYITLKTNCSARERFLDLADQITHTSHDNSTNQTPFRKAIRSLSDLAKLYWVSPDHTTLVFTLVAANTSSLHRDRDAILTSPYLALVAPPPES